MIIVCINNIEARSDNRGWKRLPLTVGKEYDVMKVDTQNGTYLIIDDDGEDNNPLVIGNLYDYKLFITKEEHRAKKIDSIIA